MLVPVELEPWPSRVRNNVLCVQVGNGASNSSPLGYSTEKSTAAPVAYKSPSRPRSPCGSGCSRRIAARAATDMSRLRAVWSTA